MTTKINILKRAIKERQKANQTKDLEQVAVHVNAIVDIHKESKKLITQLEKDENWDLLQGEKDYYSLDSLVEAVYHQAKDIYHDLHWDQKGFNTLN